MDSGTKNEGCQNRRVKSKEEETPLFYRLQLVVYNYVKRLLKNTLWRFYESTHTTLKHGIIYLQRKTNANALKTQEKETI